MHMAHRAAVAWVAWAEWICNHPAVGVDDPRPHRFERSVGPFYLCGAELSEIISCNESRSSWGPRPNSSRPETRPTLPRAWRRRVQTPSRYVSRSSLPPTDRVCCDHARRAPPPVPHIGHGSMVPGPPWPCNSGSQLFRRFAGSGYRVPLDANHGDVAVIASCPL